MQRVSAGYTIVEVMIFLAVSTALLVAGMKLVSGKQAQVDFDQTMRDTQSQIQSWIGDVSNGFTGGDPNQQYCSTSGSGGRPIIKAKPVGIGNIQPQCVFLGKAIQFTDAKVSANQSSQIFVYSIFGAGLNPSNYADAMPTPAVGSNGGQVGGADLTSSFSLGATQVTSVTSQPNPTVKDSHLIGFFNSLSSDQSSSNGSQGLNAYQFNFNGSSSTPGDKTGGSTLMNCIELIRGSKCQPGPEKLQSVTICFSDGSRTAELIISSSNGIGATTKLDYTTC